MAMHRYPDFTSEAEPFEGFDRHPVEKSIFDVPAGTRSIHVSINGDTATVEPSFAESESALQAWRERQPGITVDEMHDGIVRLVQVSALCLPEFRNVMEQTTAALDDFNRNMQAADEAQRIRRRQWVIDACVVVGVMAVLIGIVYVWTRHRY